MKRWAALAAWPALAGLLYLRLRGFPDPPGTDGYFYLLQTQSLASGAGFYFKDTSLVFLPLSAAAWFFGDALEAVRWGAALTWSAVVLLGAWLAAAIAHTKRALVFVLVLACLVAANPLLQLVLEYLKMGFSLVWLLGAALVLVRAPTPRWRWLAGGLAVGALLSHRGALLFLGAYAAAWFFSRVSWRRALVVGLGAVLTLGLSLLVFDRAWHFFQDGARFFAAPLKWWLWLSVIAPREPGVLLSLGLWPVSLGLYVTFRAELEAHARTLFDAAGVLAVVALLPVLEPGPSGFTYRLILASPLFSLPLVVLFFTWRRGRARQLSAVGLLAVFCSQVLLEDALAPRFRPWSLLDGDVAEVKRFVTPDDLLVTQHGLEFYVAQRTGLRARQFLDPTSSKRVFRLAFVPPLTERDALLEHALTRLGDDYALFTEETWRELQVRFGVPADARNPAVVRPGFVSDYP